MRPNPGFDGATIVPSRDSKRLGDQLAKVQAIMEHGTWHTLGDLAILCDAPQASISARLRDLRKPKFGEWIVERRYEGNGLFSYRLAGRRTDKTGQFRMPL